MSFEDCAVVHFFQPGFKPAARLRTIASRRAFTRVMSTLHFAANVHSKLRPAPREVRGVGARDHRFCRRAAGVDACAAEQFPLDDGDLPAALREPASEERSSLTGADDEVVEMFGSRESRNDEERAADGDCVFEERDRQIVPDRPRQTAAQFGAA